MSYLSDLRQRTFLAVFQYLLEHIIKCECDVSDLLFCLQHLWLFLRLHPALDIARTSLFRFHPAYSRFILGMIILFIIIRDTPTLTWALTRVLIRAILQIIDLWLRAAVLGVSRWWRSLLVVLIVAEHAVNEVKLVGLDGSDQHVLIDFHCIAGNQGAKDCVKGLILTLLSFPPESSKLFWVY